MLQTMKFNRRDFLTAAPAAAMAALGAAKRGAASAVRQTTVEIDGGRFLINGRPAYEGRAYKGMKVEGLLMNSRMIQGIFDDSNPATRSRWRYPDSGKWDPERNTREFVAAMPEWRRHGLLSFTVNLQGGSPEGYSKSQPWVNTAFQPDGTLKRADFDRLELILDRADRLGMAPIVGLFYFGQDQHLRDERAVKRGVEEAVQWLLSKGYRNVLLEIDNECDIKEYDHEILRPPRVHELIRLAKSVRRRGEGLKVSASFAGGSIPTDNVVEAADFLLMHGNGVKNPARIAALVREARRRPSYRAMPVLFNEDDHFDFDKPVNNMLSAVGAYASWGFFDPGKSNYRDGYQCPPVRWDINTPRKKAFFALLGEVTGA
jgi:hypothetical protein